MKIRIKFRKYGVMKFIGHLDIMRFFQKAIRRSGIDICYSEGFSPHQIMSFAAPLGVGITSDGEYLDIEVHTSKTSEASIADLNAAMVEGMEITGYVQLPDKAKPAMSMVSAADYEVWYREGYQAPFADSGTGSRKLHDFFEVPKEIPVLKKTKKSEKTIDLKQLVYEIQLLGPEKQRNGQPVFYLKVSTGSIENLKPLSVIEEFYRYLGADFDPFAFQVHRKDLYYTDAAGARKPLLEEGIEI